MGVTVNIPFDDFYAFPTKWYFVEDAKNNSKEQELQKQLLKEQYYHETEIREITEDYHRRIYENRYHFQQRVQELHKYFSVAGHSKEHEYGIPDYVRTT